MRFANHGPIRPEYLAAPAEPTAAERVAEIDRKLLAIALIPAHLRAFTDKSSVDVLLDRRNAIRPARVAQVPVIPGRAS